ncbi:MULTISPECIES: response regulator transcription factor [Sutterella]|uniref:Response regulator transcription factor n=2 Tax=Sutterella TaxID=40544 RepID=A0A6I1EJ65_9BURK|nr:MULTISPECIES: response regulator transcription factor [Sutterella]MBE5691812.1 DNA-binding response regulator [Sutterella sp.]MBS5218239.1 response regulator transcription factor [Sutterella wadsworthensis]KAB7651861.1 response regulator transcription factor [Sutterella seckii]KAB7661137.1 response regulator transcription factor [Sutterella seckii]QDA54167.1 response regulator transcription factor [Sutterella faecalis]
MKYLIVDDHALITGALSLMLEDRDPEAEVHTAATAREALDLVNREGDADLLILDLSMPDVTGTELMEEIVRMQPMLKILVVSGLADQESIMRVLQLGAAGFVPKSLDTEMLGNAIDFVLKGGVFIPSKLLTESQRVGFFTRTAAHLKSSAEEPVHLTERQKDVLALLAQGAPIKRICRELDLSEGTVKTHVAAIYRAFGASNRTEALLAARRAGFDIDL